MLPEIRKPSETYFLTLPDGPGICILEVSFRKKLRACWKRSLEEGCVWKNITKTKIRANLTSEFSQKWEIRLGATGLELEGAWGSDGQPKASWRCDYPLSMHVHS